MLRNLLFCSFVFALLGTPEQVSNKPIFDFQGCPESTETYLKRLRSNSDQFSRCSNENCPEAIPIRRKGEKIIAHAEAEFLDMGISILLPAHTKLVCVERLSVAE